MTSVICNLCAGVVMGASKTAHSPESPISRHAGNKETLSTWLRAMTRPTKASKGRRAKVAGRHAKPARAFF